MKKVFVCECGIQFGRSQEKASHCKSCKVHKYFKGAPTRDEGTKALLARDGSDALASSLNISEQFNDYSVIAGTVISSLSKEALERGGGCCIGAGAGLGLGLGLGPGACSSSGEAYPSPFSASGRVVLPPLSYVISGEKRPSSFEEDGDPVSILPPLKKYKKKNEILKSKNFKTEAEFLSNLRLLKYKNVVVILGEDISDKPEFSIYNHLSGSKDIFSYESFQENPVALYSFLRKFYFNFHFPTITHLFLKLLNEKSILRSVYTTNIDDLEFYSGIPKQKICQINGSLLSSYCPNCKAPNTSSGDGAFLKSICIGEAPLCQSCGNLLVPNVRGLRVGDRDAEERGTRDVLRRFETDLIYSDLILIIGVNEGDHKSAVCTHLLDKILKVNKLKSKNDSLIFINARKRGQDAPAQDEAQAPSPCLPYYFNHISTGILDFMYKLGWKESFDLLRKEFVANCVEKSFILPPKVEAEHVVGDRIALPASLAGVDTNGTGDLAAASDKSSDDRGDNNNNKSNDDGGGNNNNNTRNGKTVETGTIKDIVLTSVETIYVTAMDKDPSKVLYLLSTDLNSK